MRYQAAPRPVRFKLSQCIPASESSEQPCGELVSRCGSVVVEPQFSGGLPEFGQGHRGQTQLGKSAPGSGAHGKSIGAFRLTQIQGSIRQPFGDQNNKNSNQAIKLDQPPGQRMQLTLLGWIRARTHCRTEGSLYHHNPTMRQSPLDEVVRLPKVTPLVGEFLSKASAVASHGCGRH